MNDLRYLLDASVTITADEERALIAQLTAGGPDAWEARDRLIRSHLPFVTAVAKGFLRRGLSLPDLVAEGILGLIRACDTVRTTPGVRFNTYAQFWIASSIDQSASTQTRKAIRLPRWLRVAVGKWRRTEEALASKLGRQPSDSEMAAALGKTLRQAKSISLAERVSRQALVSLDDEMIDPPARPDRLAAEAEEFQLALAAIDNHLDDREAAVIRMRYGLTSDGDSLTFREVGETLGLSHERVRQLESRALTKLRQAVAG